MEEGDHSRSVSMASSSIPDGPSSSSSEVHEDGGGGGEEEEQDQRQDEPQNQQQQRHQPHRLSGVSYRLNILASNVAPADMRDDLSSFLVVLVTFWFFASMTLILGFYGSVNLPLGPNCSRLVHVNTLFVQSIKAREIDVSTSGPMLYGFYKTPPLDVEITWSETHNAFVQSSYHKEWGYFLNEGSKVDISYSVKSPSSAPLSLVIAQGRESLVEWIDDPSYPNTTLSWNIIHGNGTIQQHILRSKIYYIAVGNLNSEEVEVQLNFTIKAIVYNTTQAYYKCSLSHRECKLKLFVLKANAAILTSPRPEQDMTNYEWSVKLSYGPRWIIYFIGSGVMTVLIILAFRICSVFWITRGDGSRFQAGERRSERAPLLSQKDDDLSSWGSSYDSISHDEEELDKCLSVASADGKQLEGESLNNPQHLCVMCSDAPRECFFLPCGHSAFCFACGTRVIEEAGSCLICGRTAKKVRKIITV